MVNPDLHLFIDRYSSSDPEAEKWIAFVEKYLKYGLEQKGMQVALVNNVNSTSSAVTLYIPVFCKKSLASAAYLERVQHLYGEKNTGKLVCIGLIRESAVAEKVFSLYPDLKSLRMYLVDKDTGLDVADKDLWKKENLNFFLFKIFDLCNEAERELSSLYGKAGNAGEVKKAVYLAESSPDLLMVREEIRRELLRQGYDVFPDKSVTGSSKEVERKINEYLQRSSLSVHLLGKFYQETKPGEVQRMDIENRLAASYYTLKKEGKKSAGLPFKRIIWMPDNLIVTDENQQKFLSQVQRDKKLYAGAEIITSTVEELKDIILEKLEESDKKNDGGTSSSEPSLNDKRVVYVVISEKNKEGAQSVKSMLETMGCEVLLDNGSEAEERLHLKKCNSILFYYQNEKQTWLRSKMSEAYKFRNWQLSGTMFRRGILHFDDQELPKDDIFKDVISIKADQKLEYDRLYSFFSQSALK